jgi:hypothetical protein
LDILGAWQAAWPERYKRPDTNCGKGHAERAPRKRQDRALGQTLADQPAPARSKRHPHGELAFARDRARQQKTRHVDARNQQH